MPKLTPITVGAMNEAMPSSLTFPMSQLYTKLKEYGKRIDCLFIERNCLLRLSRELMRLIGFMVVDNMRIF